MFECFLKITAESACIGIEIRFFSESGCHFLKKAEAWKDSLRYVTRLLVLLSRVYCYSS